MSAGAVVNVVMVKTAVEKISKNGKRYAIATLREKNGQGTRWWKAFVFSESAIEAILSISDGEPIAVSGEFDCELYAPAGGESRLSWKITVDGVLSARKPKVKPEGATRKPQGAKGRRERAEAAPSSPEPRPGRDIASKSWAAPARAEVGTPLAEKGAFDDSIPF